MCARDNVTCVQEFILCGTCVRDNMSIVQEFMYHVCNSVCVAYAESVIYLGLFCNMKC